ncbi:MAG: hypothetical protein INQ03_09945 [Candidatus Heimdallarchaeota archaeon]|nr:hypothetical protein [Candidatus Heimdallarchaeota archaeon]
MEDEIIDIKGDILTLDPRSKVIVTLMMIIGVSVSIEPFQVLVFGTFTIPLMLLYRPKRTFIKKFLIATPWLITVLVVFSLAIKEPVTIHLFQFSRRYEPYEFARLIAFRFTISALHSTIMLESEPNINNIIEALAALKINENLVTILMLINRIAVTMSSNYKKKLLAARTRGAFTGHWMKDFKLRMEILARILASTLRYSDSTADILSARGFDGKFTTTIRTWTSDGLALMLIASMFWSITLATPLLR